MGELLDKLKERMDSMTQEELDAEYESITHEKFWNRWVENVHNLSNGELLSLISKVKTKYESDEYVNSEYKMGYEPRMPLYELLYHYACKYGVDILEETTEPWNDDFTAGRFKIADAYILELLIGQGTVINVYAIDEWKQHDEYLRKYYNKDNYEICRG